MTPDEVEVLHTEAVRRLIGVADGGLGECIYQGLRLGLQALLGTFARETVTALEQAASTASLSRCNTNVKLEVFDAGDVASEERLVHARDRHSGKRERGAPVEHPSMVTTKAAALAK